MKWLLDDLTSPGFWLGVALAALAYCWLRHVGAVV